MLLCILHFDCGGQEMDEKPFPVIAVKDIYRPGLPMIFAGTKGTQIRRHFMPDGMYVMVCFDGEREPTCVDVMDQMMGTGCALMRCTDVENAVQE